jgi:hypothetical protein
MTPKTQNVLEAAGAVSLVAGFAALGWVLAGPMLCVAFGLLVFGAIAVFAGNA